MAAGWRRIKKTFMYDFLPGKAQEQGAASGTSYQPKRHLVEIGVSSSEAEALPPTNWRFRKIISADDAQLGRIHLLEYEMVDHMFQLWPMQTCKDISRHRKFHVKINFFDPDDLFIGTFGNENVYLVKENKDSYFLKYHNVIPRGLLNRGDEIELFSIDNEPETIGLKLIRPGN